MGAPATVLRKHRKPFGFGVFDGTPDSNPHFRERWCPTEVVAHAVAAQWQEEMV